MLADSLSDEQVRILRAIGSGAGRTAAEIASALIDEHSFSATPRQRTTACRSELLALEKVAFVTWWGKKAPVAWVRTPAGTAALAAADGGA